MSSKFIYSNPDSSVVVVGAGAFAEWLGHDAGALRNGISALVTRGPAELPAPSPCEDIVEVGCLQP